MSKLFVTGIDTDIGKTYATGAIAKSLIDNGKKVFTQLLIHEKIIGQKINTEAYELHSPYRYELAASPHLSAALEDDEVKLTVLESAVDTLYKECDHLIIEGAGGLCVPLNKDNNIADLIAKLDIPIVLVTSPRLGSINHTLLSLNHCLSKGIEVHSVIYNTYRETSSIALDNNSTIIENNTRDTLIAELKNYSKQLGKEIKWYELDQNTRLDKAFKL